MGEYKHIILKIFLIVFVILSLVGVIAATEDFQYIASSQYNICACSGFVIPGEIQNIGDVVSFYNVFYEGSAKDWAISVPASFYLNPSDSNLVSNFINVPCGISGQYFLNTVIRTSFGLSKMHVIELNVQKCQAVEISYVSESSYDVCIGDSLLYGFKLDNKADFWEQVNVKVDNMNELFIFNLPYYVLSPGESVVSYLSISNLENIGTFNTNIVFTATRSGFRSEVPISYSVFDCDETIIPVVDDSLIFGDISLEILLLISIVLIILLILLVLIVLIFKAIKKKQSTTFVNNWRYVSEDEVVSLEKSRKPIKTEKTVKKDAKKITSKSVSIESKSKKSIKKLTEDQKKNLKKSLLWVSIIVFGLLLLGLFVWGAILASPYVASLFDSKEIDTDFLDDGIDDIDDDLEEIDDVDDIDEEEEDITDEIDDSLDISDRVDVQSSYPFIGFFTNYSTSCLILIIAFLFLFIGSLFLFRIREKNKWSSVKRNLVKLIKYSIPLLLFIFLVMTFVFCVMANLSYDWPGSCSIVTIGNQTFTSQDFYDGIELNVTELIEDETVLLKKESLNDCFCNTLFGFSGIWCLVLLIFLVLFILLIMWLVVFIPIWFYNFRNKKALSKNKSSDKISKQKSVKKKSKKKKALYVKKDSNMLNIWRDVVLLLILLLLLIGIGAYFYTIYNIEKEESFIKLNDLDNFIHNASSNLICNSTFIHNGTVITLPETQFIEIGDDRYLLEYSWYLEQNDTFILIHENQRSNRLLSYEISPGDNWLCEVNFILDEFVYKVNSTVYSIVGYDEIELEDIDEIDDAYEDEEDYIEEEIIELDAVDMLLQYIYDNDLERSFHYLIVHSGSKIIDLTDNFYDPDGDPLFFTSEINSSDVNIEIWKGRATITPASGFRGIVAANFTAQDPYGEMVTASMTIVVTNESVWKDSYNYYIIAILLILFLIILLIFFNNRKKPEVLVIPDNEESDDKEISDTKNKDGFFKNF
ncbi:MAG: Ig-like domain-containing protein [Candidatus Woesearchaeota archaeon]